MDLFWKDDLYPKYSTITEMTNQIEHLEFFIKKRAELTLRYMQLLEKTVYKQLCLP